MALKINSWVGCALHHHFFLGVFAAWRGYEISGEWSVVSCERKKNIESRIQEPEVNRYKNHKRI